jgi:hypothetical protein
MEKYLMGEVRRKLYIAPVKKDTVIKVAELRRE